MKRMLPFMLGLAFIGTVAPAQTINQRVANQRERIAAGRADGELTRRETRQLRGEERGLKQQERTERRADGGRLTPGQRGQMQQELNQDSRQIRQERRRGR